MARCYDASWPRQRGLRNGTVVTLELPADLEKETDEARLPTSEARASSLRERRRIPAAEALPESPRMGEDAWLADAVAELGRVDRYIEADGLRDVGRRARAEVQRLLEDLSPQAIAPVVYPSEGDLVIHFKAPNAPASVVIEVSGDGGAVCYAHVNGKSCRATYDASTDLPDAFLLEQLRRLQSPG